MIVGVSGYARSGKDTAAKGLVDIGYKRVAFADKLREFLLALNPIVGSTGLTGSQWVRVGDVIETHGWDGYKESIFGSEMRELMQRLGTECGRQLISDTIWIDAALGSEGKMTKVDGVWKRNDIVVTDVRFLNEAQAIKSRGGIIVRVERPGIGPANAHPSETSLNDWPFDYRLNNNGSISDLHFAIQQVAKQHS